MPELEPLDPDVLALLAHEKPVTELEPSHKAALLARVAAKIGPLPPDGDGGGGGGDGGASTGGALAAKGAAGAKAAIALAATFALGIAAGVVGDRTLSPAPPAPIATATIAAPPAPEPPPSAPEATQGVPVSALPSVAPARPAASAASEPAPSARGLAAERALLDVGRSALARGEAAEALAAADRHAKTYPEGALVEEREAIAIKALVGLGRRDEARARAADLERKYPNSLVLRAVKNAVEDPR